MLHREHNCKICGVVCMWCEHCGEAHCFNGHTHRGFDGRADDAKRPKRKKEVRLLIGETHTQRM